MTPRFLLSFVAVLALAAVPDEGQWLPQQILDRDWSELRSRGLELTKEQFWDPDQGGVLSAAIQLGGCSASFVSQNGLVVTNHHCGFGAVQQLSSLEHNVLEDGFAAQSMAEELPAPGVTVYVVRRIRDVTEAVHGAQAAATTDVERWQATEKVIADLVAEGEKEPNTTCHVASFLEGSEYLLYYRTRIPDVRLVYVPPRAIGEFGGEVDNWEWPRHTGDFTFFRAYVAPDGTPRPYDPTNVPFHPEHWLEVSDEGVDDGDLVLILGYPGRTERYLTSAGVRMRQAITYPLRYALFTDILAVLARAGEGDDARRLAYASLVKSLANVQKNALGMIEGLERNGTVERKLAEEEAFRRWVQQTPERRETWGDVLPKMLQAEEEEAETEHRDQVLRLTGSNRLHPLFGTLVAASSQLLQGDGTPSDRLERVLADPDLTKDLHDVQIPILVRLFDEARNLPREQRIAGTDALVDAPADATTGALVEAMLERSAMVRPEARVALLRGGRDALLSSDDPLVVLARGFAHDLIEVAQRDDARNGARLVLGRRWIAAQQAFRGQDFYPDANSTLRVSVATVKGYRPRDGVYYTPHTTVAGVLAKETGHEPFASPKALLAAAPQRQESRFFVPGLGDVPVCFLSDGDTTGGNSGSPVIDGKGRLVGLNFDRVFENVAGDYGWRPDVSRNISVDIRYVLWILEQVMPAPHLLQELLE